MRHRGSKSWTRYRAADGHNPAWWDSGRHRSRFGPPCQRPSQQPGAAAQVDDQVSVDLIGQRPVEGVVLTAGVVEVVQAHQVGVPVRVLDHSAKLAGGSAPNPTRRVLAGYVRERGSGQCGTVTRCVTSMTA